MTQVIGQRQIRLNLWLVFLLATLLSGCQTPAPAPVAERPQPPTKKILHHIVSRDESLYSIAWRYELDFQQLASANGLFPPYNLHPGQRLSLDMSRQSAPVATGYGVTKGAVKTAPVEVTSIQVEDVSAKDVSPVISPQKESAIVQESPPKVSVPSASPLSSSPWQWQWPATGRVVREYDVSQVQKGISIYTNSGAAVAAAAPGVVVYAGDGLRGYGNLVIVKHSEQHLSAYAHNKSLLVKENQQVNQGEKIAEVGVDSNKQNRLYFEIRENGKPVDPLNLLPQQ